MTQAEVVTASGIALSHQSSGVDDNSSSILDTLSERSEDTSGRRVSFAVSNITEKTRTAREPILVPGNFKPKKGYKLAENMVIRRLIAGGWQGGIFELQDNEGVTRQDIVLKVLKPGAVLGNLEKEWAIGQAVNILTSNSNKKCSPGFMKTYEAVKLEYCLKGQKDCFRGMILERLNGRVVEDVLTRKDFNDIAYVQDMLFQVFRALDAAYTVLGFHHTDLRLPNLMEHYPDPENPGSRRFKIIDFGLAYLEQRDGSQIYQKLDDRVFNYVDSPSARAKLFAQAINPKNHFSKVVKSGYRAFWKNREDVYHLLLSMAGWLDGRVWPEYDKEQVEQYLALTELVTGIKLKAYYSTCQRMCQDRAGRQYAKDNYSRTISTSSTASTNDLSSAGDAADADADGADPEFYWGTEETPKGDDHSPEDAAAEQLDELALPEGEEGEEDEVVDGLESGKSPKPKPRGIFGRIVGGVKGGVGAVAGGVGAVGHVLMRPRSKKSTDGFSDISSVAATSTALTHDSLVESQTDGDDAHTVTSTEADAAAEAAGHLPGGCGGGVPEAKFGEGHSVRKNKGMLHELRVASQRAVSHIAGMSKSQTNISPLEALKHKFFDSAWSKQWCPHSPSVPRLDVDILADGSENSEDLSAAGTPDHTLPPLEYLQAIGRAPSQPLRSQDLSGMTSMDFQVNNSALTALPSYKFEPPAASEEAMAALTEVAEAVKAADSPMQTEGQAAEVPLDSRVQLTA